MGLDLENEIIDLDELYNLLTESEKNELVEMRLYELNTYNKIEFKRLLCRAFNMPSYYDEELLIENLRQIVMA